MSPLLQLESHPAHRIYHAVIGAGTTVRLLFVYHSINSSNRACCSGYNEYASWDIEGVPLQSFYTLWVLRLDIWGIWKYDFLVTGNLHSDISSVGSHLGWLGFGIGKCGSYHVWCMVVLWLMQTGSYHYSRCWLHKYGQFRSSLFPFIDASPTDCPSAVFSLLALFSLHRIRGIDGRQVEFQEWKFLPPSQQVHFKVRLDG